MENYLLGLDVGGTKIEAALLQISDRPNSHQSFELSGKFGQILKRQRIPTQRDRGYRPVMEDMAALCQTILDSCAIKATQLQGIGVGLPGTVDPIKQIMLNGNSQIFIGRPIAPDLAARLGYQGPIKLENDASCFALAEALAGAGITYQKETGLTPWQQISIGIILGTGVGGGIITQGKILSGAHGGAGEIGHSELVTKGANCYCGRQGCVEEYLSGPGVEKSYQQLSGKKLSSLEIFEQAQKQNEMAKKVIDNYMELLTKFLTNLTNIFDPHYIVLGGGVSKRGELYQKLEEKIRQSSFLPGISPQIYQHQLGDSAGVLGAAFLLIQEATR